jgi:hypothetical protein
VGNFIFEMRGLLGNCGLPSIDLTRVSQEGLAYSIDLHLSQVGRIDKNQRDGGPSGIESLSRA